MSQKKLPLKQRIDPNAERRHFLKRSVQTLGLAAVASAAGVAFWSDDPVFKQAEEIFQLKDFRPAASKLFPEMAILRGQKVEDLVRAAFETLGGVNRFIAKGDRVLLKPNVGWDRQPEQAANTNPEVVRAVAQVCREAGAGEVWVSDVSINDPHRCFRRSGIEEAAQSVGAELRFAQADDFLQADLKGQLLQVWPVSRFFIEADKVINLPIAKHHSLSGSTLSMKNWYGAIGGRRNRLHQNIHTSIADLAQAFQGTLTILDATRVLMRNGPTGGSLADVSVENTLVAGLDEVAIDSFALHWFGLEPEQVDYLGLGEQRGLGTRDWKSLNHKEVQLG